MKYLLDTNVVSELRKNKPHGAVLAWLETVPRDDVFVSAIALGELQAGVEITRKQNPEKAAEIEAWVEEVARGYSVLPMDAVCCREWGRSVPGMPHQVLADAMIAATARVHDLTVATRNESDFQRFDVAVFNPFK